MIYKTLLASSALAVTLGISLAVYAGGPEVFVAPTPSHPFFLTFGSGYSFSNDTHINADPLFWDASPQGYNSTVKNSEIYTAGFGVHINPLISADIEATYRPSFSYQKFQTSIATGTVAFAGNKTRYFDFSNASVMANLLLHGQGFSDHLLWQVGGDMTVQPIIGGGAGIAYNRVSDFHSVEADGSGNVVSIQNPQTTTSMAWQALAGLELAVGQRVSIDTGYRYFSGGKFRSNNYYYSLAGNPGANAIAVTPWRGRFKTGEIFINLNYNFV